MTTGKKVFVTQTGVQYLLDKYLSASDIDDLRRLNTEYSKDRFQRELIARLEKGSDSNNWIPSNYEDELVVNAGALIGSTRRSDNLKNVRQVDVYETKKGTYVYEDKKGRVRDFKTGRFVKKTVFEE